MAATNVDRPNDVRSLRISRGIERIIVGADGERSAAHVTEHPVELPTTGQRITNSTLREPFSSPKRQLIQPVELEIVSAIKARQPFILLPIIREWKKQKIQFLVVAIVDSLRECVSGTDLRAATEPSGQLRLQRVVIIILERDF